MLISLLKPDSQRRWYASVTRPIARADDVSALRVYL